MSDFEKWDEQTLLRIFRLNQKSVLTFMHRLLLSSGYKNIIHTPAYIVAEGTIPVALIAHADTVFKETKSAKPVYYDREQGVMWSPMGLGADDRAGIYSIVKILRMGYRPHVIITTDEESGAIGAGKLISKHHECPFEDMRFMIQLDRRGTDDSVFYDCDNDDFEEYVNRFGFKTALGSFSDISVIAPVWKIAAVNLSIGYNDEHSFSEILNIPAMCYTIDRVVAMLEDVAANSNEIPKFEYIEAPSFWEYWGNNGDTHGYDYGYGHGYKYFDTCDHCGQTFDSTELTTLYVKRAPSDPFKNDKGLSAVIYTSDVCTNCFGSLSTTVHWCSKCNKGWVFRGEQENAEATAAGDQFVCQFCQAPVNYNKEK